MQLTITAIKTNWTDVNYKINVDGDEKYNFNCYLSRKLTNTYNETGNGIFSAKSAFDRDDTSVVVDFGSKFEPESFENPALEIKRRVDLVNSAFEALRENYQKIWIVNI